MKRAAKARDGRTRTAQNWAALQVGDLVDVIESGGYTYPAYIDAKTEQSDIVWVRASGFGTRHLLHQLDGTRLRPREEPERPWSR